MTKYIDCNTEKKQFYVGFTVLELNKWLMYDFH